MTLYKCPRCGHETNQKNNLRKHFLRKKLCPNIIANISIEECFKTILFEDKRCDKEVSFCDTNEYQKVSFCDTSEYQKVSFCDTNLRNFEENEKNDKSNKTYECDKCKKSFSKKNNLYRHIKHYCKNNNNIIQKELENHKNEILTLKKEIDSLKNENKKINIGVQNNQQINNIQNNNISINAFGKENLEYVTKEFIQQIVREGPYGSIQKLIKYIHFNPNHKENQNIKIPNKRDKFGMVFNGEKWLWKNKQNMINEIAGNAFDLITDHCEDLISKKYNKFCLEFENKQVDCIKRIMTDTELLILNFQKE